MPMNPTTGKRYKGINAIHLMAQGRGDSRWLTYKQAEAVGAQVKRGERGTPVQYWKFADEQEARDAQGRPVLDAKGEPVKEKVMLERPRVFFATVFNAEQIEGLPPLQRKEQTWDAQERAEAILAASGADIRHGAGDRAFYRPASDSIHLPEKGQFPSADRYYATALHELGHWTGHESRLNRDLVHPFGSEGYAKEELRAEIASMILGDELGIGRDPGQHAAYVGSWVKALEDDPLEIFRAAADAEKIQGYVLAFEQKLTQEQEKVQGVASPDFVQQQGTKNLESILPNTEVIDMDKLPDWTVAHTGTLADKLEQAGLLTRVDAVLASALRDMKTGTEATREVDLDALTRASVAAVGVAIPAEFTGQVLVLGVVRVDGVVTRADEANVPATAYQVFARDGAAQPGGDAFAYVGEYRTEDAAQLVADRLALVDAYAQVNADDRSAKLAWIEEVRIRRDPASTDADRMAAKESRKTLEFTAGRREDQQERVMLAVPFREKEQAKSLGAKWDRQAQSWFVPPGVDPSPFQKWAAGPVSEPVERSDSVSQGVAASVGLAASQGRIYLAVPYGERDVAKAAGAAWDKVAKSWYAGPKADMEKLQRWAPENVPSQQGPAMSPQEEFAEALRSLGCVVEGKHPMMDGKTHRIPVEGDKKGEAAGFYVGHLDGHPAGYIKNNKTNLDMKWKSKGYALDPEEKAKLVAEAATKLAERAAEQTRQQEAAAQRIAGQIAGLSPVEAPTAYMLAKGIEPQHGALTDKDGQKTYIPATDVSGKVWTMQYIQEDGTKRFAKESKKRAASTSWVDLMLWPLRACWLSPKGMRLHRLWPVRWGKRPWPLSTRATLPTLHAPCTRSTRRNRF
ncbi:DNA primase TraC [Hydrogenophaga sp. T4]|nr:DNA primase TraC [Hydrogenophaga sp. T4]